MKITNGDTIKWVCTNYAFSVVVSNRQDWTSPSGQLHPVGNPPNDEGIIDSSTNPGPGNVPTVVLQFVPANAKPPTNHVDIDYLIICGAGRGLAYRAAKQSGRWFPKDMYEDMAVATMTWQ